MARLTIDDNRPQSIRLMYSIWRMAVIGGSLGLLYWLVTLLVSRYIVDPIYCGTSFDANVCSGSIGMSGDIATIIVATVGLGLLVRYSVVRPIIVAVASAFALWSLARWTEGLPWYETLLWSVILYGLSYVLFSWIGRYSRTIIVATSIIVVLIVLRVIVLL